MSPNKLARAHCWTGTGCLWRVSHSSAWRCLNVRVTGPWKGGRPLSPPDLSTMPCTMTSTKSTMMLPRLEVCGLTVGPRRVYSLSVSQDIWHQPAATTCTKIAALTLYRPSKCPRHGLLPVEVGSSTHILVCSNIALHSSSSFFIIFHDNLRQVTDENPKYSNIYMESNMATIAHDNNLLYQDN